jgi:hypothetical protein
MLLFSNTTPPSPAPPHDSIVAAITTLAFPEDEATERDVRNARRGPAVTPLAAREALLAAFTADVNSGDAKAAAEAVKSLDTQSGDPIRKTPPTRSTRNN